MVESDSFVKVGAVSSLENTTYEPFPKTILKGAYTYLSALSFKFPHYRQLANHSVHNSWHLHNE